VEEEDEDAVYSAKRLIDSYGLNCLTVHAATLHVNNETEIPKALYYGRVSADFASTLSAPILVIHSNVSRRLPKNLRNKFLTQIFKKLIPYAKNLNLRLSLENLSYASSGYGKNVTELEEILGVIGDEGMGITIDFCHAEATGTTLSLLERYKTRLSNIHISNRAHKPFIEETPNLKAFITKLKDYGYNGALTIELSSNCSNQEILQTKKTIEKAIS
jgi:sugar phosphate isomerase/epimerase